MLDAYWYDGWCYLLQWLSGAGSSAIDFTQLGHQKCFGPKYKN